MTTTAYVTFDEDDAYDVEVPDVVHVDLDTGDSGFVRIHNHDEEGACTDSFIPRERIKMIIVRTEHAYPEHSIN